MKKIYLYSTFILLFTLSSCTGMITDNVYNFSANKDNAELFDGYYKPHRDALRYYPRDINSQIGWFTSNTIGEQKILIIPVQLTDAPIWTYNMINDVNNAFFGDSKNLAFYSVHDYFYKSSYGNLNISGEVGNVLNSKYSVKSLNKYGERAPELIIKEFLQTDISKYTNYNLDNDNFLDNVVFLYSNNYSTDNGSSYWAWCSYYSDYNSELTINNYMWASYQFLNNCYYDKYNQGKLETHTFIHETGHLLGLDDYYCYDESSSWDPAGVLDMQSYNVGDHNVFSKFLLGWLEPYVITDECEIELKTSSLYPEAILIKNDWNGSSYDEYLLIEYYTPLGLNEIDSIHPYTKGTKMYDYSGLRIYHVDSRLVELVATLSDDYIAKKYVDIMSEETNYSFCYVGASNSVDRSFLKSPYSYQYKYLHLLDKAENNRISNRIRELDPKTTLWTEGSEFSANRYFFINGDSFNDGEKIDYKIAVSQLGDVSCKIKIYK